MPSKPDTIESYKFSNFLNKYFLFQVVDHPATMLPDSTLTVLCEIGGFKRITNRSDYQRVRSGFEVDSMPGLRQDMSAVSQHRGLFEFLKLFVLLLLLEM